MLRASPLGSLVAHVVSRQPIRRHPDESRQLTRARSVTNDRTDVADLGSAAKA